MKFKPWKKLSYRQKQLGEAFYTYFKETGEFSSLADWEDLPTYLKSNLQARHNYIVKTLELNIPQYKDLAATQKDKKKYYEFIISKVDTEVYSINGVIFDDDTPVSSAIVTCNNEQVITNEKGEYFFTNLKEGKYIIKVTCEDYSAKSSQVTLKDSNVTRNININKSK